MAEQLIHYDTNIHTGMDELFNALQGIPNFWDTISEESNRKLLTKGGVTLEISALNTGGVSGYGRMFRTEFDDQKTYLIAATSNALIFDVGGVDSNYYGIALGANEDGTWGAVKFSTSPDNDCYIMDVLAPNVDDTSYSDGRVLQSVTNTQIVDMMSTQGDFVFADLRRVLFAPDSVKTYTGKFTMPNGEKYVKCGGAVLRYTE